MRYPTAKGIDTNDFTHHMKPLWCVYGDASHPSIMCCKLVAYLGATQVAAGSRCWDSVLIWGHSIWRGEASFRTYGISAKDFAARHNMCVFFDVQDEALAHLRKLTADRT